MNSNKTTKALVVSLALVGATAVSTARGDEKGTMKQNPVQQGPVKQEPAKPRVEQEKQTPVKQRPVVEQQKQVPTKPIVEQQKQLPAKPIVEQPKQATAKPIAQNPGKEEQKAVAGSEVKWGTFFSAMHQGAQYSRIGIELAQNTGSQPVRDYAAQLLTRLDQNDAALVARAEKLGFAVKELNRNERIGMVMQARANGEIELLRSLTGEAFDQEFLTRVISCNDQILHGLERNLDKANTPDLKSFLQEKMVSVTAERDMAQTLLDKICDAEKSAN